MTVKRLILEVMGRHSNLILVNNENRIIDAIKHVDNEVSSVREVMPARTYVLPPSQNKLSPEKLDMEGLFRVLPVELPQTLESAPSGKDSKTSSAVITIENFLLNNIKGFSPLLCREICYRTGLDSKAPISTITPEETCRLKNTLKVFISKIELNEFTPCLIFDDVFPDRPLDFHCMEMLKFQSVKYLSSISSVLDTFYSAKDKIERSKQKKSDLLKVLSNSIDRCNKKLALQNEKLGEVADREKLKLFGELITANIYCIPKNVKSISLLNYYSENSEHIEIPLNENLLPQENAQKYFKQYSKARNTFFHTNRQVEENLKELEYLESVLTMLENCNSLQEIDEIRQELLEQGYIFLKKKGSAKGSCKKQSKLSPPLHFISSDGLDIFIGKNNRQNDMLTLKQASSNDIWLHTRNIPGSHVIIKKTRQEVPDSTLLEAAILASFHSKAGKSSTVPVDYTTVKNVKKPNGAKPGMVIYENFRTVIVTPDENKVKKIKERPVHTP